MLISDDKLPLFNVSPFRPSVVWNAGTPDHGGKVSAYSIDSGVPYCIPFKVAYRGGAWRNAATGDALKCEVKGWRL